jgi:hypothetical protein
MTKNVGICLLQVENFIRFILIKRRECDPPRQGLGWSIQTNDGFAMKICLVRTSRLTAMLALALFAALVPIVSASVHTYNVGDLANPDGDEIFSASWLHDASGARNVSSGTEENGAYRSGKLSDAVSGSLYGDLNGGVLSGIGGTLTGNLSKLLKHLDPALKNQEFTLKLGASIGSSNTGALQFNTNGSGPGEFTGGFIDYLLEVASVPGFSLAGTFFFKPQAETGSTDLSPNRGDSSAFTLWGYNWMHDSGPIDGTPASVNWQSFLSGLGYTGDVSRSSVGQTLGIALFASDPEPPIGSHAPEPTTFLVWCGLAMVGVGLSRRPRSIA